MKKRNISLLMTLIGMNIYSQTEHTVNQGLLKVEHGTEVSTYFDFKNESTGNVLNDGSVYLYGHYQNEGLFSYSTNSTTGYVVFEGSMSGFQNISGSSPSSFYDVLFNKSGQDGSFNLTNDIATSGTVNLTDGVVLLDKSSGGAFVFLKGSNAINAKNSSYVKGEVTKVGNDAFTYPIGDAGYYRLAGISAPSDVAETYTGEYLFKNSNEQYPHQSRTGIIDVINDKEYWIVNQSTPSDNSVILTLSWDDATTPKRLTQGDASDLHIVRWDEVQKLWVDEGGVVDFNSKTVTTPTKVEGFGVFTLAKIKSALINPGDVVIYEGVTPDGDGMNDYLIIDNIEYFPNNHVTVVNRWGRVVYETRGYNTNNNVFRGIAEGTSVVGKGEKLPSGTYYYIVEYLYDRDGQNQWVKKVGHLHLENE